MWLPATVCVVVYASPFDLRVSSIAEAKRGWFAAALAAALVTT